MPGRQYAANSTSYRYGFNGKENDNDVKKDANGNNLIGGQQDYGMRIYDPRAGRFLSVDPLYKQYPWNSTYAFAENDVIRCVDLDGLEKVIIMGGADLSSTGLSKTTLQTAADIQRFSDKNKLNYEVKTFDPAPWNPSQVAAFDYIKANYKKGESIIVYGYSMGGVAATQLTKLLETRNIKVNLLVVVDGAYGLFSKPLMIPDNVEADFNFYQTDRSKFPVFSRGYPAVPLEGNDKTKIININYDAKKSVQGAGAHGKMADDTQKDAEGIIKTTMMGNLNEMIKKIGVLKK